MYTSHLASTGSMHLPAVGLGSDPPTLVPSHTTIGVLKLAAIAAVLSAGVVAADGKSVTREAGPVSGKIYTDRVPASGAATEAMQVGYAGVMPGDRRAAEVVATGKGDPQREKPATSCEAQVWPYVSRHCMASTGSEPRMPVRTITIESREGANTSMLTQVSAAIVAQRW